MDPALQGEKPKVSILIPTLNAAGVLETCLKSISIQNYPKDLMQIIIADGGSTDSTRQIAQKYGAKIVENPLKTGEAGKMSALKAATGKYVALIDSDNILPDPEWLNQMIEPLEQNPQSVGSEPWSYTWRKEDGFIARYCALIGMNDPFVMFLGNYDRINLLTGTWTGVPHKEENCGDYLLVTLNREGIPTIGANGTVFRSDFLKQNVKGDYLFDIDIIAKEIKDRGEVKFIKVKNGIIHTFCESDIGKFARKQKRRVKDFLFHSKEKKDREFTWEDLDVLGKKPWGMLKFILYCITILPLIVQAVFGYIKKPDFAWFFHPLACWITLWEYGSGRIIGLFSRSELSREMWKQ